MTIPTNSTAADYEYAGVVTGIPNEMEKGQTVVVEAELTSTQPLADYTVSIFNPLGYDDVFNIGKPTLEAGASYSCSDRSSWDPIPKMTISGSSTGKYEYKLKSVLNTDSTRDINNVENKFKVKFPLTAMQTIGQYAFTVALQVADETIITQTQDITIGDTSFSPTISSVTITDSGVQGTIYAGGSANFYINVQVPAGSGFEFTVEGTLTEDVEAVGLYIFDTGMSGGFDTNQISLLSNTISSSFGTVTNGESSIPTIIVLHVSMKVGEAVTGEISQTLIVGGQSVALTGTVSIPPNEVEDISGIAVGLGPTNLHMGFAVGIECTLTIPPTVYNKHLSFMVYPDYNGLNVDLQLWKVEITHVGASLPCIMKAADQLKHTNALVLSKSKDTKLFDDTAKIDLGKSCPSYSDLLETTGNQFKVKFIYDLPDQKDGAIDEGVVQLNGGLYVEDSALWTSMYNVTTAASKRITNYADDLDMRSYDDANVVSANLADLIHSVRMEKNKFDEYEAFAIRFLTKIPKQTRGNLQLTIIPSVPDNFKICKIEVANIGKNLGRIEKPGGYTKKDFKTDIRIWVNSTSGKPEKATISLGAITNFGTKDVDGDMYADDDSIEIIGYFTYYGNQISSSTIKYGEVSRIDNLVEAVVYPTNVSKTITINQSNAPQMTDFFSVLPETESVSTMNMMIPKTIAVKITLEKVLSTKTIRFVDKDFSKKITFCGIYITKVGSNFPCTDVNKKMTFPNVTDGTKVELDEAGNVKHYKEVSLEDYSFFCYVENVLNDEEANSIQIELTFKANENAVEGDQVTMEVIFEEANETSITEANTAKKEVTITLSNSTEPDVLISNLTYPMALDNTTLDTEEKSYNATAVEKYLPVIYLGPGEFGWVGFNISVPREATVPIKLAIMTEQYTYNYNYSGENLTESEMTIHDVRFTDSGSGINICCTSPIVDPWKTYGTSITKSGNSTAYMQQDTLTVDLGYVTNGGYTYR